MKLNWFTQMLMEEIKDPAGGGGGGDLAAQLAAARAEVEALKAAAAKPPGNPAPDESDLAAKAQRDRLAQESKANDTKRLETAIVFTHGVKDWAKTNAGLLPKNTPGIMEAADKEIYNSAIEKEQAIKAAIIQEFFSQQANLDLLTVAQKSALEDFKKLAKTDRHERVGPIFDTVFEPTFERIKDVHKAKQVALGLHSPTDTESAYKEKMIAASRRHYLKEK